MQAYLDRIRNDMSLVTSPRLTGMPHAKDPKGLDEIVIRYEEISGKYEKQLKIYQAETMAIEEAVQSVADPRLRMILRYRYMDGYKWDTIADLMHYEVSSVYKMHGQALKELGNCQ